MNSIYVNNHLEMDLSNLQLECKTINYVVKYLVIL